MNWNEYKALAIRTESIPNNDFGMLNHAADQVLATRVLHAAMGLTTEFLELDAGEGSINAKEELGDIFWYLAILDTAINLEGYHCKPSQDIAIMEHVGEVVNLTKRHIFYGKELELGELRKAGAKIYAWLVAEIRDCGFSVVEIWEANIKKLEKRYPNKYFDKTDAVTRDVENELSHIDPSLKIPVGEEASTVDINKLVAEAKTPLTAEAFNALVARCLTDYQYTQAMKGLAFIIGTNLRSEWAMIEARAYDAMYRSCTSLTAAEADNSLYSMWKRLGYPHITEADVRGKLEAWK